MRLTLMEGDLGWRLRTTAVYFCKLLRETGDCAEQTIITGYWTVQSNTIITGYWSVQSTTAQPRITGYTETVLGYRRLCRVQLLYRVLCRERESTVPHYYWLLETTEHYWRLCSRLGRVPLLLRVLESVQTINTGYWRTVQSAE